LIKVLVIDDSALVRKLFSTVLASDPELEIFLARDGVQGLDLLHSIKPQVVTLDIHMPHMDGLTCLDRIMIEQPCPVVIVSSLVQGGVETTLEALRRGAVDFVEKPEGAISLYIDEFAPKLISKVRAAAGAKLNASLRLRERVRSQMRTPQTLRASSIGQRDYRATGAGLVLVGASTGGPSALESLLAPLTADFPLPILVSQHMPASFTGSLARRLDACCAIAVSEVSTMVELQPGCAYIGRGDADVVVARKGTALIAAGAVADRGYPWRPSVNRMVESAMEHVPPKQLIGVLLTGMGNDGARAMVLLHASGGATIAEAEETAVVWGMPGELVKAGGADWILPVTRIAERLQKMVAPYAPYSKDIGKH
jgi:two-component system chemotaxis response regulator CheB